jgi:FkbM family methyltransferase
MKRSLRKSSGDLRADAYIWAMALSGQILSLINHRLFWRVCNALSKTMPEERYTCELVLDSDCEMKIFLDDPYWSQLVASSYSYEPEILHVLERLKHAPYTFIDCGANIGYWSIMVSGEHLGAHKALAIEASPKNFEALEENWALNGKRFKCANVALFSVSGQRVTITTGSSGHHSGHRISRQNTEGMRNEGEALTATLDDVVKEHFSEIPDCPVVKIDVEGAEIDVLRGAPDLLERDVLLCYEDKTGDLKSDISRYVLEELELAVFFATNDGQLLRVRDPEEVTRYMNSWRIGGLRSSARPNFFACKEQSRFLEEYLV